jgi:hypothetical protein
LEAQDAGQAGRTPPARLARPRSILSDSSVAAESTPSLPKQQDSMAGRPPALPLRVHSLPLCPLLL